tara:strand:- start:616 stop:1461 length:846 start_codon:yes stop_codon:yes gene_type:complete
MKIGVIGNGFVGHAMTLLRPYVDVRVWDIDPKKREPAGMCDFDDFVYTSQLIFIAVPTPMRKSGSCDLRIVRDVVQQIKVSDYSANIVLRSTVPPGTSEELDVSFMPEFLTEKNWASDFKNCQHWVIGTNDPTVHISIQQMLNLAHDSGNGSIINKDVQHTQPTVAEFVKYAKNCFLATKVSFFNELHSLCESSQVDYNAVRKFVGDDSRIGSGHTHVPGHDGNFGFGGTCFPKDMSALSYFAKKLGVDVPVLNACIRRNDYLDRPNKDWENDTGRAVSDD